MSSSVLFQDVADRLNELRDALCCAYTPVTVLLALFGTNKGVPRCTVPIVCIFDKQRGCLIIIAMQNVWCSFLYRAYLLEPMALVYLISPFLPYARHVQQCKAHTKRVIWFPQILENLIEA